MKGYFPISEKFSYLERRTGGNGMAIYRDMHVCILLPCSIDCFDTFIILMILSLPGRAFSAPAMTCRKLEASFDQSKVNSSSAHIYTKHFKSMSLITGKFANVTFPTNLTM